MRTPHKTTAALAALASLAASATLAACGGDDGPGDPVDTVERIFQATINGDGETACALATEEAQQNLIDSAGNPDASCEKAVDALAESYPDDFAISDPEVLEESDDSATVRVTLSGAGSEQQDEVGLTNEDGEWKISGDADQPDG